MGAEAGVIVARSSRTGSGSAGDSAGDNSVGADDLIAQKARILLMLALTVTDESAAIQRMFNTY